MAKSPRNPRRDRLENAAVRGCLSLALALPYRRRVPVMGWIAARIIAPLAGWRGRIRENLAYARPDLPPAEIARLVRDVPDNIGRSLVEVYSGAEFKARAPHFAIGGPGLAELDAAAAEGRPAIVVSGHFGNYEAGRAALIARGCRIGALYRPMSNAAFNEHYVESMAAVGEPLFAKGRKGFGELLRFLRRGGMLAILHDLHTSRGFPVTYFGRIAPTAPTPAELALKLKAPLIPVYAIRQANGLDFEIVVEEPVPHTTPEAMVQALNDSLEARVRANMDQWFWVHRRWKPERRKKKR